jgi:hypothetical protein
MNRYNGREFRTGTERSQDTGYTTERIHFADTGQDHFSILNEPLLCVDWPSLRTASKIAALFLCSRRFLSAADLLKQTSARQALLRYLATVH